MKKNIFLSAAIALALCVGNSAVATTFYNDTNRNVIVIGARGAEWDVYTKSYGRFPAGLRDNLTIKLGRGNAAPIIFDLKKIKEHFWFIDNAHLKEQSPNQFTLNIAGKVKGDPNAIREKLANLCRCLVMGTDDGRSTIVRGIRTKEALARAIAESKARD